MRSAPRRNRKNPPRGSKTTDAMMARAKVAAENARKFQHRLLKLRTEEKLKADARAVQLQGSIASMKRQLHRLRVLHSRKGNSITTVEPNVNPLIAEYEQIRFDIQQQLSAALERELHPTLFVPK